MKLTQDEQKAVIDRYQEGESLSQLGESYGVSLVTIRNVLRRHDVPRRARGRSTPGFDADEAVRRYQAGESQQAIANSYGTSQAVISRLILERGLSRNLRNRDGHGNWKGGRVIQGDGYVLVWMDPGDPLAAMRSRVGYVLEHRLVMARSLGRPLQPWETVHHINGVRDDNRPENLELWRNRQPRGQRANEQRHCPTCTCDTED